MSDDFAKRKPRREPMELQLTAMIDIFSMIVIFLILGTVFGASEVVIPSNVVPPKSLSKEILESAPHVAITSDHVLGQMFQEPVLLELFRDDGGAPTGKQSALRAQIAAFSANAEKAGKTKDLLLNVVADQGAPYRDVFDVIRVFRESGFRTMLFIASGDEVKP